MRDEPLPKSDLFLYQTEDGSPRIQCRFENQTVWPTQHQKAELFQRGKSVISRHIKNLFEEGELVRISVIAESATTAAAGKSYRVEYYNLDVIISVGCRVKSQRGAQNSSSIRVLCRRPARLYRPWMRVNASRLDVKLMFWPSVTMNLSQRIRGRFVHRPPPVTFNLSQLGSP